MSRHTFENRNGLKNPYREEWASHNAHISFSTEQRKTQVDFAVSKMPHMYGRKNEDCGIVPA
jgi:hypothetical protein